jgi:hypothetical protein
MIEVLIIIKPNADVVESDSENILYILLKKVNCHPERAERVEGLK